MTFSPLFFSTGFGGTGQTSVSTGKIFDIFSFFNEIWCNVLILKTKDVQSLRDWWVHISFRIYPFMDIFILTSNKKEIEKFKATFEKKKLHSKIYLQP